MTRMSEICMRDKKAEQKRTKWAKKGRATFELVF